METSDEKAPGPDTLGGGARPFESNLDTNPANGHVARNARVALAAVDVAQPYVCVTAVASPLSRAAAGGGQGLGAGTRLIATTVATAAANINTVSTIPNPLFLMSAHHHPQVTVPALVLVKQKEPLAELPRQLQPRTPVAATAIVNC